MSAGQRSGAKRSAAQRSCTKVMGLVNGTVSRRVGRSGRRRAVRLRVEGTQLPTGRVSQQGHRSSLLLSFFYLAAQCAVEYESALNEAGWDR